MTIAVRPSLGRPGLGLDERIRDGGAAVIWQPDPTVPHARLYAVTGTPRYRRASSCAAPGLYGIVEIPDGSNAVITKPDGTTTGIDVGVWGLWATQGDNPCPISTTVR